MRITVIITISFLSVISELSASGALSQTKEERILLGVLYSIEVFDFSGLGPAIEMALETIEEDETLPFGFDYVHNDSKVNGVMS